MLLHNIQEKEQLDLLKKHESAGKALQQKALREQQLKDLMSKRQNEYQNKQ
jgi:hypothetical protein